MAQLLASDLYALALGTKNTGKLFCHWCGGACDQRWQHNEDPPIPFTKMRSRAKHPSSGWVCAGCWLWQRRNTTVVFLSGAWQDRQCAQNHSWFVTAQCARAVRKLDSGDLYEQLCKPPHRFVLSLATPGNPNQLQCAVANDLVEVQAGTPLRFTVDNVEMQYTVHELEEAGKSGGVGKEPGVQALLRWLDRPLAVAPAQPTPPPGRGRPPQPFADAKVLSKTISKSGAA